MNKEKLKNIFNKKLLIKIYFMLFILLNIIDFLNIIGGDLDFFKKLLSWLLIAYLFYNLSPTRLFVGKKNKKLDLMLILVFCLIVIPKSLFLYVYEIDSSNLSSISDMSFNGDIDNYYIFSYLLDSIKTDNIRTYDGYTTILTFIGFILTIILSIYMYSSGKYKKKSFLGSLNLKDTYFKSYIELFLLIAMNLFFVFIVFNLFMEWFALAVDALTLVIGLIYYLFKYIHHHTNGRVSSTLNNISNTGSKFYQKLISMFTNKKTIFIAMAILLSVHLLVDIGVYLVPYTIGTVNGLYFGSLSSCDTNNNCLRSHNPIFSFNPETYDKSLIYNDIISNNDLEGNFLLMTSIITNYVISIFIFFIMMFLPFYILYKNMTQKKN